MKKPKNLRIILARSFRCEITKMKTFITRIDPGLIVGWKAGQAKDNALQNSNWQDKEPVWKGIIYTDSDISTSRELPAKYSDGPISASSVMRDGIVANPLGKSAVVWAGRGARLKNSHSVITRLTEPGREHLLTEVFSG